MKQRLWVIIKSMWVTLFINSLYLYLSGLSLNMTKHVAKVSITNEFLPSSDSLRTNNKLDFFCKNLKKKKFPLLSSIFYFEDWKGVEAVERSSHQIHSEPCLLQAVALSVFFNLANFVPNSNI